MFEKDILLKNINCHRYIAHGAYLTILKSGCSPVSRTHPRAT